MAHREEPTKRNKKACKSWEPRLSSFLLRPCSHSWRRNTCQILMAQSEEPTKQSNHLVVPWGRRWLPWPFQMSLGALPEPSCAGPLLASLELRLLLPCSCRVFLLSQSSCWSSLLGVWWRICGVVARHAFYRQSADVCGNQRRRASRRRKNAAAHPDLCLDPFTETPISLRPSVCFERFFCKQ